MIDATVAPHAGPRGRLDETGEILPYTALRGVAAWWVVAYHFREFIPVGDIVQAALSRGALAVDLFFIMSGFVMALSYGRSFQVQVTLRGYLRFIMLRLGRIYPVHLLVLLLFISVPLALSVTGRPPLPAQFSPGYFVQSLFLVQAAGLGQGIAWNLPAWSISTEMIFYLLFPFVLLGLERGVAGVVAHLVVMACVLVLIAYVGLLAGGLTDEIDRFGVYRCVLECTAGVLLYRLALLAWPAGWRGAGLLAAAAGCAGIYAAGVAADYVVVPLGFVCLLWALLDGRQWLGILLSNPVLLWLGRLSYATYMVHFLMKYWVKFLLLGHVTLPELTAVYMGGVLVASILLHYLVELPARRVSRGLVRRWFDGGTGLRPAFAPPGVASGVPD